MAQIDINKLKKTTPNKTESTEFEHVEPTKTQPQFAELTDNTSKESENHSETDKKAEPTETKKAIAIVRYIGYGVWKDSRGELWANEDKTVNIVSQREYSADEYQERDDLRFMVGYGAMKMTIV